MALPPIITDGTVTLTWGTSGRYYGYCTLADVLYEFPNSATQAKNLTPQALGMEISASAQEMQNQLALVYQMPYVGTDGGILQTLRQINVKLATANLIDRIYAGAANKTSPSAAELRAWAELIIKDILDGVVRWSAPFGDAVAMAETPVYPTARWRGCCLTRLAAPTRMTRRCLAWGRCAIGVTRRSNARGG